MGLIKKESLRISLISPATQLRSFRIKAKNPSFDGFFALAPHTGHGTITGVGGHKTRQMRHDTHIFEVSHLLTVFDEQIPHLS